MVTVLVAPSVNMSVGGFGSDIWVEVKSHRWRDVQVEAAVQELGG